MGLASSGAPNQHKVALGGQEVAGGQIMDQSLVDAGALEGEVLDILGQRQLGDGHLVLDRSGLLLGDLGGE
ncbi:hypothetical protein D3C86_2206660 [compost metagenome]